MMQDTIKCPKCGEIIRLSQAISKDIEAEIRRKYEEQSEKKELEFKEKIRTENEVRENEFKEKLKREKKILEDKLKREMADENKLEISDLKSELEDKKKRLEESEKQELELRIKHRELEEREKKFELEMNRKLDNERQQIEDKIARNLEDNHRLKDAEKDKQLTDMRRQIEDLKRKAEQGSQKIQGEVLEVELEQSLKNEFPFDDIDSVSSGVKGADIVQTVKTQAGRECGKILWETKRTRTWSDEWIQKLKDDQRSAKADLAVIVSEALPKGFHHFRQIETVWVTDIPSAISLALALRTLLIQINRTRETQTGKEEKKEVIYNYLTGLEFRNRVQAIMEAFIAMKKDLDSERRAMEGIWAKRDKQIEKVVLNIAGMRGDLEGIVGASLPSIKLLELPSNEDTH